MAVRNNRLVYQFKVTLAEIDPPVWRRIQVWDDIPLSRLHRVLQLVMNWEDYHLHEFQTGRFRYGIPDPDDFDPHALIDDRRQQLRNVPLAIGGVLQYLYDFGDEWQHDLLLEAVMLPDPQLDYPLCIAGERNGPPEDAGGPFGYANYLKALANRRHPDHKEMLEWRGPFDPEAFSLDEINARLRAEFRPRKRTPKEERTPKE